MLTRNPTSILTAALTAREHLDILITTLTANPTTDYSSTIDPTTKRAILKAARDISRAVQTPVENLFETVFGIYDWAALQAAVKLEIINHIGPMGGDAVSDEEVSKKIGKSQDHVHRILKLLAANDVVEETAPGCWRRREMAEVMLHPVVGSFAGGMVGRLGHFPTTIGNWLEENPYPTKTFDCPFTRAMGATFWEVLSADPEEAARFGRGMEGLSNIDASVPVIKEWLIKNGRTEGVFRDVGGGSGWIDERLAPDFPDITFEIQDINPQQWAARSSSLPPSLHRQLTFTPHSFFTPQPPSPTPVIALLHRWILHDWANTDAIAIIRNIVPALEQNPDAAYLINDNVLPDLGEWEPFEERSARQFDLVMMSYFNAKERSRAMWERLLREADERLEIVGVTREGGMAAMALIEVRLRKEEVKEEVKEEAKEAKE
ncbi:S-adenosyl-L-methionine-dependent methyltransferase [Ascodesmis nigricans]|uniref:S-adenosyl-L-methionine-dependent methyltransferase n=1 Tax=Ascodesmis nigricans TaxID=341454 RepID=A0A4S2MRE9_9PEZI|nr:S-adenosyl-L-methionine-dependent methyltransferase [Ascodesmis nigricans]